MAVRRPRKLGHSATMDWSPARSSTMSNTSSAEAASPTSLGTTDALDPADRPWPMALVGRCTPQVLSRGADVSAVVGRKRKQIAANVFQEVAALADELSEVWACADPGGAGVVDISDFREALDSSALFTEDDLSAQERSILLSFLNQCGWCEVQQEELTKVFALLTLLRMERSTWETWFSAHGQSEDSVHKLLKEINGPEDRVSQCEAEWVVELMQSTGAPPELQRFALCASVAYWTLYSTARGGVLREKLIMRLELEQRFGVGCVRFVLLVIVFGLFATTLLWTSKSGACRGIYNNLVVLYDLKTVRTMNTWGAVRTFLAGFSQSSSALAPLSHQYFNGGAELDLLVQQRTFTEPEGLSDVHPWLGNGFTMKVWLELLPGKIPPPGGLPIFRRALAAAGKDAELSCLSWNFPPSLAFGAHDYGHTAPNNITGRMEEFIRAYYPMDEERRSGSGTHRYREYESMRMHTLVVNGTDVRFYINDGVLISSFTIARPITDCANAETTLGAPGLTLAALSFLPTVLTPEQVAEVFRQGTLLSNTGYSIKYTQVPLIGGFDLVHSLTERDRITATDSRKDATFEVQSSAALTAGAVTNPVVPVSPHSDSSITPVLGSDPTLGVPAWTILQGPVFVNARSENMMDGDALPKLTATTGFGISAWLKFDNSQNGFLIARAVPKADGSWSGLSDVCWSVYIGGGTTFFQFRSSQPGVAYGAFTSIDDTSPPEDEHFQGKSYRHFFFQVDPTAPGDPLLVCIDGVCDDSHRTFEPSSDWSPVDCEDSHAIQETYATDADRQAALGNSKIWLTRRPPGAWPFKGFIKNFKVFNTTLTKAQVKTLFDRDPDPDDSSSPRAPMRQTAGCKTRNELMDDNSFVDEFGHSCYWYYKSRIAGQLNCERNELAKERCPVACLSVEQCWSSSGTTTASSMSIWNRQQEFHSTSSWGTSCVAKSTTPAKEAIKCGLGAPLNPAGCKHLGLEKCGPQDCTKYEFDREGLLACLGDVTWMSMMATPPPNRFMPCAEIVRTHEPTCDWDDSGLDDIAASIAQTQEWSLLFWFEPILSTTCLQPQLRLLDGDGFTFSVLAGWLEVVLDPPEGSGCNKNTWLSHALHGGREHGFPHLSEADVSMPPNLPKPGEKHLVVMGRMASGLVALQYDDQLNTDNANQNGGHPPIKGNRDFLRVINVLGDVRLSSIKLQDRMMTSGDIAMTRYTELASMQSRRGAYPPLQEQVKQRLGRNVNVFTERTMMVAPPVVLQSRGKASGCPWHFSDRVIQAVYDTAQARQCSLPYVCDSYYTTASIFQCASGQDESIFFGMRPEEFLGRKMFMEFLTTITDFPIVVRRRVENGPLEVMHTENFLDTLTQSVEVAAIYYSAEFGIGTRLSIVFQAVDGSIEGRFSIQHLITLTGDELSFFWLLSVAFYIVQAFLLVDNVKMMRDLISVCAGHMEWNAYEVATIASDALIQIVTLVYFVIVGNTMQDSGRDAEDYIGNLQSVDWSGSEVTFADKKNIFRQMLDALSASIVASQQRDAFGMAIALLMFMRVIMATNAHPRIALITSTLGRAASDMFHFFLLFILVLWGFAVIGSWRFGSSRDDMRSVPTAMKTQIDAILGPPGALPIFGKESEEDASYLIFAVLLHFVNFFFLVNFFLAIVVDAFTNTVRSLESNDTEMDIVSDTFEQMYTTTKSWCLWWPSSKKIVFQLKRTDRRYLNAEDFASGFGFRDQAHASTFFHHYLRHSFVLQDSTGLEEQRVADEHTVLQSRVKAISRTLGRLGARPADSSPATHVAPEVTSRCMTSPRTVEFEVPHEPLLKTQEVKPPLGARDLDAGPNCAELADQIAQMRADFQDVRLEAAVDREVVAQDRETLVQLAAAMKRDREQCAQLLQAATRLLQTAQVAQSASTMNDAQANLERRIQEAAFMRESMQGAGGPMAQTSTGTDASAQPSNSVARATAMQGRPSRAFPPKLRGH